MTIQLWFAIGIMSNFEKRNIMSVHLPSDVTPGVRMSNISGKVSYCWLCKI